MTKQPRQETFIYVALWAMLFVAPVLTLSIHSAAHTGESLEWTSILEVWKQYAVFLVVFLIHNYILAPLIIYNRRRGLYVAALAAVLGVFTLYQCNTRPGPPDEFRHRAERPPFHHGHDQEQAFDGDFGHPFGEEPPADEKGPGPRHGDHKPPVIIGEREVVSLVVLILMLGMNWGVKLFFKHRDDQKRMDELQKENLAQQLEYLRYQINPHFLMNTLNNIHALVDIDAEKAKETIVELSKIMRFVLYEGAKTTVPLQRELGFLENYVRLMRMRYTDKVQVCLQMPTSIPDCEVPPLLLITFVENAFKHGVSYQQQTVIDIKADVSDRQLHFTCRNTKTPQPAQHSEGGVGLQNVKRRLDLIYGDRYTLTIDDAADNYNILLVIPL